MVGSEISAVVWHFFFPPTTTVVDVKFHSSLSGCNMYHLIVCSGVSLHPFLQWHVALKTGKGSVWGAESNLCYLGKLSPHLRQLSFPPVGLLGRMLAKQNHSLLRAVGIKNIGLLVLVLSRSSERLVKWLQSLGASLCCNCQELLVEESHRIFLSRNTPHHTGLVGHKAFAGLPGVSLLFSLALSQQLWLASGRTEEPAGSQWHPWKLRCVFFLWKWNK